jgi:hypothetical protein
LAGEQLCVLIRFEGGRPPSRQRDNVEAVGTVADLSERSIADRARYARAVEELANPDESIFAGKRQRRSRMASIRLKTAVAPPMPMPSVASTTTVNDRALSRERSEERSCVSIQTLITVVEA